VFLHLHHRVGFAGQRGGLSQLGFYIRCAVAAPRRVGGDRGVEGGGHLLPEAFLPEAVEEVEAVFHLRGAGGEEVASRRPGGYVDGRLERLQGLGRGVDPGARLTTR